jgi:DNA polymerase-3 subunit delta'
MIRIDAIRELRRDLHMRPFEADRRVYLLHRAHLMNEDAADALLKDLEEPPPYAVVILIADDLGPISETIRSRCQLVPFRRLSETAVRTEVRLRAPDLSEEEVTTIARVAAGRLDRAARLLDPAAQKRRETLLAVARAVYLEPAFDAGDGAQALLAGIGERGVEAKEKAEETVELQELTGREAEQRVRRAQRGAERDELLAALEELEWWYRDLVVLAAGAEGAVVHVDRLDELRSDATRERLQAAERACAIVRAAWREAEELQLAVPLALEALLTRLRHELAGPQVFAR